MLLAYDADGNVVATLDYVVMYDDDGVPLGLVDFAAHEEAGGEHTDIWVYESKPDAGATAVPAKGSKVWPEWIGGAAHDFRVELVGHPGNKRIGALVHKTSGHRRVRATIEADIADRIAAAGDHAAADIRDLVGGPDRPLPLDTEGKTKVRVPRVRSTLPLVSAGRGTPAAVQLTQPRTKGK
jgi:hypothetical protein